ncbi:hypothetical protein ACFXG4_41115 [Nocardia sp. NPDC059246]|uniref:hypothetical protein n=1 Tax=unclassified Nocardia TaxID=2637762 RepID=UPI0036BE1907
MNSDLDTHIARVRVDPCNQEALPPPAVAGVLVVGYRASFHDRPTAGTRITAFPRVAAAALHRPSIPTMALVSVEPATRVVRVCPDGRHETGWSEDLFPEFVGWRIRWSLLPVDADFAGGFVIAEGSWAAGGYQAVLTRSALDDAPGAPTIVAIHNTNPWTGRSRW